MKKSLMLAASALAVAAFAGDALAIDVSGAPVSYSFPPGAARPITDLGLLSVLGNVDSIASLGPTGTGVACRYSLKWRNPTAAPGGAARLCELQELNTAVTPGCGAAAATNVASAVVAGAPVGTVCGGFDANGLEFTGAPGDNITLILNEAAGVGPGALTGVVIYPAGPSFPINM